MVLFVENILVPYFDKQKQILSRPPTQMALWQIDVWSVHRGKEFRGYMSTHHQNILVDYVPGGCTGVAQACDVGMNRPIKHSMKRSYHEDIVQEAIQQLDRNEENLSFDTSVAVERDRTVAWMWNAWEAVNNPALIRKVSSIGCS